MMYLRKTLVSLSLNNPGCIFKPCTPTPTCFSLLFFSSFTKQPVGTFTGVSEYLLKTHNFSPETASRVSSLLGFVRNPLNCDSVLSFLKDCGLEHSQLELAVSRNPRILHAQLNSTVKPKIKILQDSGFDPNDIARVVSANPWLLTQVSVDCLSRLVQGLKSILGSNSDVTKALERFRNNFALKHFEETWVPNIEFSKRRGVNSSDILQFICRYPTVFLRKPATFKEFVKTVEEMGLKGESKMFLHAVRTFCCVSVENLERKLQVFQRAGFSKDDIKSMFRRMPPLFMASERKLKEATEFLLTNTTKMGVSVVVDSPVMLMYSVEGRLKPRLQVLEILERENIRLKMPGWARLFEISDQKFFQKYVHPYSDRFSELKCIVTKEHRELEYRSLVENPQTMK